MLSVFGNQNFAFPANWRKRKRKRGREKEKEKEKKKREGEKEKEEEKEKEKEKSEKKRKECFQNKTKKKKPDLYPIVQKYRYHMASQVTQFPKKEKEEKRIKLKWERGKKEKKRISFFFKNYF